MGSAAFRMCPPQPQTGLGFLGAQMQCGLRLRMGQWDLGCSSVQAVSGPSYFQPHPTYSMRWIPLSKLPLRLWLCDTLAALGSFW